MLEVQTETAYSSMKSHAVSLVIPVYNEGQNFHKLWARLKSEMTCPFVAYVCYDFDADDTVPVMNEIIASGDERLIPVLNTIKRGVVGAICSGFNEIESGPVIVLMADLSDDISQISDMLHFYEEGFPLVCASRYSRGGRINGGPLLKKTLSRIAGMSLHYVRGLPTNDATNAFKLYDRELLRQIKIESKSGFELSLEITVKAYLLGYSIAEFPTTWTDRLAGESKFQIWNWLPEYLRWYLHAFRPRQDAPPKLLKRPEEMSRGAKVS